MRWKPMHIGCWIACCLLVIGGALGTPLAAQTPAVASDKLAWDMRQDPSGLSFAVVIDGTRQTLSGVTCGAMSDGISVCQVNLPAMTPGTHRLSVIATGTVGGTAVDSAPSSELSVSFIAIVTPENVRLIKG